MNVNAVSRDEYLEVLSGCAGRALPAWRGELERWSQGTGFSKLWGYNPPGEPLRLAAVLAYLRSVGCMGREASRETLAIVRAYAAVRDGVDRSLVEARAETREAGGLPLFVNFFLLTVYAETIGRLRTAGDLDAGEIAFLERELAAPANLLFAHPEWGGHNRAIIRADGLSAAAAVLPGSADAARWRRMADILAADSAEHWEIEDASIYQPGVALLPPALAGAGRRRGGLPLALPALVRGVLPPDDRLRTAPSPITATASGGAPGSP